MIDQAGNHLPGVIVRLSGTGWSTTWTTDSNGFFYFEGLCASDLIVAALVRDRVEAQSTVTVTGGADSVGRATLRLPPQTVGAPAGAPVPAPSPRVVAPAPTLAGAPAASAFPSRETATRLPRTGFSLPSALFVAACFGLLVLAVRTARYVLARRS